MGKGAEIEGTEGRRRNQAEERQAVWHSGPKMKAFSLSFSWLLCLVSLAQGFSFVGEQLSVLAPQAPSSIGEPYGGGKQCRGVRGWAKSS